MLKNEHGSEIGQQAAAAISMFLPVVQFFYQWLPTNLSGIFLGRDIFFFVSILTLILSLLVIFWYRTNPYFRWIPPWMNEQKEKYNIYLSKINRELNKPEEIKKAKPVSPPFEFNSSVLSAFSIPLVFILGLIFVFIGLTFKLNAPIWLQVIQAFTYTLTIVLCAFSATHYYLILENQKEWKWINQTKIQRVIQLAIENNGFPDFPKVLYIASGQPQPLSFPASFVVVVNVNNKRYRITTDQAGEILQSVEEVSLINEPTKK